MVNFHSYSMHISAEHFLFLTRKSALKVHNSEGNRVLPSIFLTLNIHDHGDFQRGVKLLRNESRHLPKHVKGVKICIGCYETLVTQPTQKTRQVEEACDAPLSLYIKMFLSNKNCFLVPVCAVKLLGQSALY